ncbi:methyl-accepting chemotaxis protein [Achromobacter sp. 413638]|uniref:methyl-accepting chemotaxis protein n=1 Tax=Achromobacter sp. 413638 TaxID=3342385 RepID=UPI00370C0A51
MHWLTLNRLLRAERGMQKADLYGQIAAIHKAQAVIEFDLQGHVLMANQNFLDTMGYSLDEVLGQHHRMFIRPEERDSAAYAEFWDKLGQGAYDSGRYRRVRKDGTDIWLQATYSPICDKRGRPLKVIKYATDVSEQQQRQADFEGQLAAISKVQAIIEFELDGTILRANELFLDAMGYRADEVVGRHHSMFVTPEEARGAAYQEFWRKLREGRHDAGQYLRIGKGGRQVWIEASYNPILDAEGRPFKVVKYATDITKRFTAAQTLRVTVQGLTENAERASQANTLAQDACKVAEEGGRTVQDVVRTMSAITDSSRRISEIIGVMDGIAFQTNILALNAAVEAARAGPHGKGFAVVAAEVRSLAQNSAAAAKEIKGLITTSVEQIQAGAVQVQSAGSTMDDIVTSSHRVTEIMGEVVQASLAQSSKLGDVTEDITAMTADAAQVLRQSTAEREVRPVSVVKPVAQGVRARPAANTPMPSKPVLEYVRY